MRALSLRAATAKGWQTQEAMDMARFKLEEHQREQKKEADRKEK